MTITGADTSDTVSSGNEFHGLTILIRK